MNLLQNTLFYLFNAILFFSLHGCHTANNEKEEVTNCAKDFAFHYFNLDFDNAFLYCTAESKPWIQYRATNITQKDIDVFTSSKYSGSVEVMNVMIKKETDSTAFVTCKIHNVFVPDSLEKTAEIVSQMTYIIPLVNRQKKWLVKMEAPLQSEK